MHVSYRVRASPPHPQSTLGPRSLRGLDATSLRERVLGVARTLFSKNTSRTPVVQNLFYLIRVVVVRFVHKRGGYSLILGIRSNWVLKIENYTCTVVTEYVSCQRVRSRNAVVNLGS